MTIGNEAAYDAAIARRIADARRRKAANKSFEWLRADETRVHVIDYLNRRKDRSDFCAKLANAFVEWGTLTEGQEAAVRRMIAQDAERAAARAVENAARAAVSKHVGTVGERGLFGGLKVEFVKSFETQFGTMFVHGMVDADGNVVVYKGSAKIAAPGETLLVKATVKEHGQRDGIAQTILSRPQVIGRHPAQEVAA